MQHLLAAWPQVVEVVLGGGGISRHLLNRWHLEVLDILLQVGEVDPNVIEGEGEVQGIGVISAVELCPVV